MIRSSDEKVFIGSSGNPYILHSISRSGLCCDLAVVGRILNWVLDTNPSLFFESPVWLGLRGQPFNALQGFNKCHLCASREESELAHHLSCNYPVRRLFQELKTIQRGMICFQSFRYLPHLRSSTLYHTSASYPLPYIIISTSKSFCSAYVLIEPCSCSLHHPALFLFRYNNNMISVFDLSILFFILSATVLSTYSFEAFKFI